MDFNLSEDQHRYVETVQKFVKQDVLPRIMELDRKKDFPEDLVRKAWELGLLNLSLPAAIRGYDMDLVSTALIVKELSYGDTGLSTSAMCNDLANVVVAMHGTEEQQETFLRPFAEEPALASFCLTEPGAGSDNSAMTAFIRKTDGGRYVLNGEKCFITNASLATQFTVFCKVGRPDGMMIACLVIPHEAVTRGDVTAMPHGGREIRMPEGGTITTGKPEEKLGQHLSNTTTVAFEDVVIPENWIIGNRRLGFHYAVDVLDFARPMVAAIGLGLARRAFDVTLTYTQNRTQFGQRICDLPVARNTLVTMWKKIELAEAILMKAAWKVQESTPDRGIFSSLAKNTAAEAALFCSAEGLHLHGGYGFMAEYEISKLVRDAHIIDIYEGTREVQDMIIGREIV